MNIRAVTLPKAAVSHWSTSMYGVGRWGHVTAYANPGGTVSTEGGRTVLLNLDTPGGKADGVHGGARRIDVALTPSEARELAKALTLAAKGQP